MRWVFAAAAILYICGPRTASAEWQLKPFVGGTYGGDNSFALVPSSNKAHFNLGINGTFLGDVFGVEADIAHTSGFFDDVSAALPLVADSGVTTMTGNVIVAMPRRLAPWAALWPKKHSLAATWAWPKRISP